VSPKFASAAQLVTGRVEVKLSEIPESYGTHKLLLLVRDPHCLYSHWDLTLPQLRRYNELSAHKHLVLKVRENGHPEAAVAEIHVHPESRSWFIHVERAETQYVAELGYYCADQTWVPVTISEPVITPPDTESEDRTELLATMAPAAPTGETLDGERALLARRYAMVQGDLFQHADLGLKGSGQSDSAFESAAMLEEWTPAHARALAEHIKSSGRMREQTGSLEILDLLSDRSSLEAISSESATPPTNEFWLDVNAELLIYGATKSDARVTFDAQPITLRADGTFSRRISFPDGQHEMVIEAVSTEGDSRQVRLKFSRCTEWP
jgi:hypothetical protein